MDACMQRVRFSTAFENIQDLNPSFAIGRMRIAYVGDNRNGSSIPREVLQAAIPTMFNCPIVANYDRSSNLFGSHDVELVLKDNAFKIVNVTQPVGVVPLGAEYAFELDVDANGVEHEYLSTDVILWKRQEAFEHICEVGAIDESMEVVFSECHMDDRGYLVADRMYFEAFCLLESAKPCYEGARVEMSAEEGASIFAQQYAQMMSELAKYAVSDDDTAQKSQEGGKAEMDFEAKIGEILSEFNLTREELDFEISEDMTLEEIRDQVSAFAAARSEAAPADVAEATDADESPAETFESDDEPADEVTEALVQSFAATYNEKRDALRNALDPVITDTTEVYFFVVDFDDTYVFVERDTWDVSTGAFEEDHGRFSYTFDDASKTASLTGEFEPMIMTWLTEEEYAALEARRALLDELLEFRAQTLKETYQKKLLDVLGEFVDLNDVEEFAEYAKAVQNLADNEETRIDIETVREHCFCIRGKQVQNFNQKLDDKKVSRVSLPQTPTAIDDDPVGRLFEKFSK